SQQKWKQQLVVQQHIEDASKKLHRKQRIIETNVESNEQQIPLMSSRPLTGLDFFSSSSTSPCTVLSIPFFTDTGFAPEVTLK
ncbi:hypothetical protein J0J30_24135, partial [Vibrio vulnificus]|nr:hypothetical protein [Vibrio vulnificus]